MPFDSAPEIKVDPYADLAEAAADLLEKDGWCQRTDSGPLGQTCLMGAILGAGKSGEYTDVMAGVIKRLGFHDMHQAIRWNDVRGRTVAEVIARLRSVRHVKGFD